MSKVKKAIFFGLLFLTAVLQLVSGQVIQGAVLLCIATLGVMIFEKREANRGFYRALTKLLGCADIDACRYEMEVMERNALIISYVHEPLTLLKWIEAYYISQGHDLTEVLEKQHYRGDYAFWHASYLCMLKRETLLFDRVNSLKRKVPSYFRGYANERVGIIEAIMADKFECLDSLRSELKGNLHIAEVTGFMADKTDAPHIKAYYVKSALNLSRGLIK